jgi:hypothetical protein
MKRKSKHPAMLAWAVTYEERGTSFGFIPKWGNGHEWQYPVFPTQEEARRWKKRHQEGLSGRLRVVRVAMVVGRDGK